MVKSFALWLYDNAERVEYYLKNALDVFCLLLGLMACFAFLLIGGAM